MLRSLPSTWSFLRNVSVVVAAVDICHRVLLHSLLPETSSLVNVHFSALYLPLGLDDFLPLKIPNQEKLTPTFSPVNRLRIGIPTGDSTKKV